MVLLTSNVDRVGEEIFLIRIWPEGPPRGSSNFVGILEPWRHCQTLLHGLVFCQTLLHGLVLEQVPFAKVSGSASRARRALEALPDTFAKGTYSKTRPCKSVWQKLDHEKVCGSASRALRAREALPQI